MGIATGLRDAATWPDDLRIAVNISPLQFVSQNIVPVVMNAVWRLRVSRASARARDHGGGFPENNQATRTTLHQLRELGVRIAMDDFGTWIFVAELSAKLSVRQDKIDRSFIGDLSERMIHRDRASDHQSRRTIST